MATPLTGAAEESIAKLKEKVKANLGQIVLCSRDMSWSSRTPGCFPSPSLPNHHYETGIVNGDLQTIELTRQTIDLPSYVLCSPKAYRHYSYLPELSIPVQRKLSGFFSEGNTFQFDIKDLEKMQESEKDAILIALNELPDEEFSVYRNIPSFSSTAIPRATLNDFGLYVGDEEVSAFLEKRKIKNVDELRKVLKSPDYASKRVETDYFSIRKKLVDELVIDAGTTAIDLHAVRSIERSVMDARWVVVDYDQDHGYPIYGWNSSTREPAVEQYIALREKIRGQIQDIEAQIKQGNQLYANASEPLIDGSLVGLPAKIKFPEYADWLSGSFIPELGKVFSKLDAHIREEKAKEEPRF